MNIHFLDVTDHIYSFIDACKIPKTEVMPRQELAPEAAAAIRGLYDKLTRGLSHYEGHAETVKYADIGFNDASSHASLAETLGLDELAYNSVPADVRKDVEESDKLGRRYAFVVSGRKIELNIVVPVQDRRTYLKLLRDAGSIEHIDQEFARIAKQIYVWLFVCGEYASAACSRTLRVNLLLSNNVKVLPSARGQELRQKNVNSAFTNSCSANGEIYIYRCEEYFKVFIHETMHSFGMDFSGVRTEEANVRMKRLFSSAKNVDDLRVYESYAETWAELINLVFYVFMRSGAIVRSNFDKFLAKYQERLYYEAQWSAFQCFKVLDFYNMRYEGMYESGEGAPAEPEKFKEGDTHVLSYYIIKAILMFHANEFLVWCDRHNGETNPINMRNSIKTVRAYCKLIETLHDRPRFLENIRFYEKRWERIRNAKRHAYELRTLRMSAHQF
jgi:hypothetical protein